MDEPQPATTGNERAATPARPDLPEAESHRRPAPALQVIDTIQTVLTALSLAFIFRAFLVEAFIIPTGSMAQSLLGAHATRTCPACGYEFDFSPASECFCPNCHLRTPTDPERIAHKAGDRILVHKWPFALGGRLAPERWEVIVFRSPADPGENYIKRVIGLPGETVEVIDGDVFIDGRIVRKTAPAQQVLWFVVFDQSYYPHANSDSAEAARWVADGGANWTGLETRVFRYRGLGDEERNIRFAPNQDRSYFQDVYAYNRGPSRPDPPYFGDVRMAAEVTFRAGEGSCRWEITRNGNRFLAEIRRDGAVSLTMAARNGRDVPRVLGTQTRAGFAFGRPYRIEFGHLDYQVYVQIDGTEILRTTDADYGPDIIALRTTPRMNPTQLRIGAAALDLDVRGLRVDRDVYYTYRDRFTRRAYAGHPFALGSDEYFVLGDNSPDSRDSREWDEVSPYLPADYRLGTVRADQIVGPAALVYLPGLLPVDEAGKFVLPDVGRVRFVR